MPAKVIVELSKRRTVAAEVSINFKAQAVPSNKKSSISNGENDGREASKTHIM